MKKLLFLLIVFNATSAFSQAPEAKIFWDENPILNWKDFEAAPKPDYPFDAMVNSGISFSWSLRSSLGKQKFISFVKSYFTPSESWVKPGKETEYLLAHEQLHFDISELHARKLKKAILEYKTGPDIKKDLNRMFDSIQAERAVMQERFDLETRHSMDTVNEAKWQKKIKVELEKLKGFASD